MTKPSAEEYGSKLYEWIRNERSLAPTRSEIQEMFREAEHAAAERMREMVAMELDEEQIALVENALVFRVEAPVAVVEAAVVTRGGKPIQSYKVLGTDIGELSAAWPRNKDGTGIG